MKQTVLHRELNWSWIGTTTLRISMILLGLSINFNEFAFGSPKMSRANRDSIVYLYIHDVPLN